METIVDSSLLDRQLKMLDAEMETVNSTIRQMDDFCKNIKQWAITLWTLAVGGALSNEGMREYVAVTAAIPLLFWFVDTWYRRIQRKFIWRSRQISSFLNDGGLKESVVAGELVNFRLWDPKGVFHQSSEDYQEFSDWKLIMRFPSVAILYVGLMVFSVGIWIAHLATR